MWTMTKQTAVALVAFPVKVYYTAANLVTGKPRDVYGPMSILGASRAAGEIASTDQIGAPAKVASLFTVLGSVNLFVALFNFVPLLPLSRPKLRQGCRLAPVMAVMMIVMIPLTGGAAAPPDGTLRVTVLAVEEGAPWVKYIHGDYGKGAWTYLGGHDPEDPQHAIGSPPTDLALHPNSPGYRLILNNVLFPAAKKKPLKT